MMRKRLYMLVPTLALALGLLAATLGPAFAANLTRYILPGNTVFPEGIAYQQGSPYFYVSSNADGTIFRGNLQEETTSVFLPGGQDGRTSATGMKVDNQGRLFVSGAATGRFFVYDTATGQLLASFSNGLGATFINDVAVTRQGDAYFTDSINPVLYRITTDSSGQLVLENWLDLTGTPIVYGPGFNLNGIDVTENGRYLITVQSNTGKLFRIDIATQEVIEIDLGGATVVNGDGILLRGHTLYVARNAQNLIVKVQLSGDFSTGSVVSSTTDPSLHFPTTLAVAHGRMLVVNSQFDRRCPGCSPDLPFTVSSIRVP